MALKELVYSVLVVSSSETFNNAISDLLPFSKYQPLIFCKSISEAKRTVAQRDFDLIIINSPLPDDVGIRFSIDNSRFQTVVLLLTKSETYLDVTNRVTAYGVFTLSKPISRPAVAQALNWMTIARERIRKSEQKNASIEDRIEEIRIINRAKLLLISELKMTEAEAHRYIEKNAMDTCVSKRITAETIIKTYS